MWTWFLAAALAADPEMAVAVGRLDELLPSGNAGSVSPTWAVEEFRAARARFGKVFAQKMLPEILEDSVERHYWVAIFLAEEPYLRGDPPDRALALTVLERGLAKLPGVADEDERVHLETKVRYVAALYAQALGQSSRASAHKARVEELLRTAPDVASGSIPAVEEAERATFDAIGPPRR
jgi:hypothetical protein